MFLCFCYYNTVNSFLYRHEEKEVSISSHSSKDSNFPVTDEQDDPESNKVMKCAIDNHDSGYLGMAVQLYV